MKEPAVIVITGTPGTGKSSVAGIVAARLGARLVSLNEVAVEAGALAAVDRGRDSRLIKVGQLRKALNSLLKEAVGQVVFEGHFGELVPKAHVKKAIVLRTNPLVLGERLRARGYPPEKVKENVEAELLDSCLIAAVEAFGEDAVREVDTTSVSPGEAAELVLKAVEGKGGLFPGSTSWITLLESEGRLRELIP